MNPDVEKDLGRSHRLLKKRVGWLLLGGAVIFLLLVVANAGVWATYDLIEDRQEQKSDAHICPLEDDSCNDFDPCHVCTKRSLCDPPAGDAGAPWQPTGDECGRQYYCDCRPVPNGTCCNQQDYCYLDDPEKRCVYGTCMSPNQTLCRGACPYNTGTFTPCNATIPILDFGGEYPTSETFCVLASCVTLFTVNGQWTLCDSFLDQTNLTNRQTAACSECTAYTDPTSETTTCMCQWNCAPFGGNPFGKKRAVAAANSPPVANNGTIYFMLYPGMSFAAYSEVNQFLNTIVSAQVQQLKSQR